MPKKPGFAKPAAGIARGSFHAAHPLVYSRYRSGNGSGKARDSRGGQIPALAEFLSE